VLEHGLAVGCELVDEYLKLWRSHVTQPPVLEIGQNPAAECLLVESLRSFSIVHKNLILPLGCELAESHGLFRGVLVGAHPAKDIEQLLLCRALGPLRTMTQYYLSLYDL